MDFSKYFSFVMSNSLISRKKTQKNSEASKTPLRFHEASQILRRPSITEQVEIFRQELLKKSNKEE